MSSANVSMSVDVPGLDKLRKAFKTDLVAKIGVFGAYSARQGKSPISNSELAVVHIFGSVTKNIPARDFLRMPIEFRQKDLLKAMGTKIARSFVLNGDAAGLLGYLGLKAEVFIQEAFESRGYGQWPPNKTATIRVKGSSAPLIDTAQLRRSITSVVEKA